MPSIVLKRVGMPRYRSSLLNKEFGKVWEYLQAAAVSVFKPIFTLETFDGKAVPAGGWAPSQYGRGGQTPFIGQISPFGQYSPSLQPPTPNSILQAEEHTSEL